MPLITITNNLHTLTADSPKSYVIIVARAHPGETNSSYVLHGLIQFLLSTDRVANKLRDKCIFKIIPMINPDGVIAGNNRTAFTGRDLNRCYTEASPILTPEIFKIRALVNEITSQGKLLGFFDLHQHSGRKSVFMYAPYFPLHSKKYLQIRMLPKLLAEQSEMFRYYSCKFRGLD